MSAPARPPPAPDGCPPPEELTALAHGEREAPTRAALLRHVLACEPCRREHEAARSMLLRLAALGAARASRAPLPATASPERRWTWLGLLPPVAAAALVLAALGLHPGTDPERSTALSGAETSAASTVPAVPALLDADVVTRLLAAQAADGHWSAEGELSGVPGDACATGVVLLALVRDGAAALERPSVEAAVVAATRWLEREGAGLVAQPAGGLDRLRAQAVLTAALLRASELRPDARTEQVLSGLLDVLVVRATDGAEDRATRPWLEHALTRAQAQGWRGARRALRHLLEAPLEPAREVPGGAPAAAQGPVDCSALGLALEALREAPPVRTLALAPVCRVVAAAR